ncbi:MAG: hypothetical protein H6852_10410 [Geminicoccaceae bacterium]|jgi:hypothetical protein|nr:hypothetical protein [Geminicoccaceae bacterium]HRY24257.1 hypothetical protein [Geminicoccaceae bacterium]
MFVSSLCFRPQIVAAAVLFLLTACSTTRPVVAPGVTEPVARGSTVLLLRPDIECLEVAVGGTQARPEWTAKAEASVTRALADFMREHETRLVVYDGSTFPPDRRAGQEAAIAALTAVRLPASGPAPTAPVQVELPAPELLAPLREDFKADYALSVFLRESFQSAGHVAMRYSLGLLLGPIWAPMPGTGQYGYATLVDLRTGEVAWSNTLSTVGEVPTDIRDPEKARDTVDELLEACPV